MPRQVVVGTGDRVRTPFPTNLRRNRPLDQNGANCCVGAVFIKPVPNVRRVFFIATPHRGSYLTEYLVTELPERFLTLPRRVVQIGAEPARNAGDFQENARNPGSGETDRRNFRRDRRSAAAFRSARVDCKPIARSSIAICHFDIVRLARAPLSARETGGECLFFETRAFFRAADRS